MKEDSKSSELLEQAGVLLKSVEYWNSEMDKLITKLSFYSEKEFLTPKEMKRAEKIELEIDKVSRRLDLEYASIEKMENKIEKQLRSNEEKKKKIKSKSSSKTRGSKKNSNG